MQFTLQQWHVIPFDKINLQIWIRFVNPTDLLPLPTQVSNKQEGLAIFIFLRIEKNWPISLKPIYAII